MDNKALYNIGYGLYILTAKTNDKQNGCIVNTLMQITSNPVTILVGVNKNNLTHDIIKENGIFNLSLLTEETPFSVFQNFGFQSGKTVDKFLNSPYYATAPNGVYCVTQYTNSYLAAKVLSSYDMDTHTLFRAVITDAVVLNDKPSVTYSYYQNNIKPKPQASAKKGFRCNICGYEYYGDTLPSDFSCPICKHGVSDFSPIN